MIAVVLACVIWAPMFACAATDVASVKTSAKRLFVDGIGLQAPVLSQAQMDSLDRLLRIEYDVPELQVHSCSPYPYDMTCGHALACGAQRFTVTPGMDVSVEQVRGENPDGSKLSPNISWNAMAGKKYTLIFIDFFSSSQFWPDNNLKVFLHGTVINADGSDLSTGTVLNIGFGENFYFAPANPDTTTANNYAFLLYEHEQMLQPNIGDVKKSTFSEYMQWLNAPSDFKLVALNWFRGHSSVWARGALTAAGLGGFAPSCDKVEPLDFCGMKVASTPVSDIESCDAFRDVKPDTVQSQMSQDECHAFSLFE